MESFLLALPMLPLIVLVGWISSPSLRRRVPLRAKKPLSLAPVFLLTSVFGFVIVGLFGLSEGAAYALRALLLDRSTTQALAWGPALLAYVSLAIAVASLIASWRASRDA